MAHALLQPTKLPHSIGFAKSGSFDGSNKSKCLSATMLRSSRSASKQKQIFMEHRGQQQQSFLSKVAAATSFNKRGRNPRMIPRATLERFTEKAIKVMMLSEEEARRLGHNFVGTEQILLGLIGEGTGLAAKALKAMGVSLKDARVEVEKIIGRGSGFCAVEIPFTPRAKRVLQLSLEEARQLGHNDITPEHLLLGLLREGEGGAARVLENLGVDVSNIRTQTQVIRMIGEGEAATVGGNGSFAEEEVSLKNTSCYFVFWIWVSLLLGQNMCEEFEERLKKLMEKRLGELMALYFFLIFDRSSRGN